MSNKVNVNWQIASTLFIPSGLWAFRRIKKLTYGIIIYACCDVLYSLGTGFSLANNIGLWDETEIMIVAILMLSALVIALISPMIFIRKWSIAWNQKLESNSPINLK